jgi:phosphoglucomutase
MVVEVVDPVADYAALMESCSTSTRSAAMFAGGFTMRFDAMHAVTGPYATRDPRKPPRRPARHGGQRRRPCPISAAATPTRTRLGQGADGRDDGPDAPDFGAASDGDGDRNMMVGRGVYVSALRQPGGAGGQCRISRRAMPAG